MCLSVLGQLCRHAGKNLQGGVHVLLRSRLSSPTVLLLDHSLLKLLCCRTHSRALARVLKMAVADARPTGSCL